MVSLPNGCADDKRPDRQHPQCEGVHQNRYLFSSEDLPQGPMLFTPLYQRQPTSTGSDKFGFSLSAGSAHGLAVGDELTVFPDRDALSEQPLGTLLIDTIDNFTATLKLPPNATELRNFTSDAIAVKSKSGRRDLFKLAVPPNQDAPSLYSLLKSSDGEFENIATTSDEGHLTLTRDNTTGDVSLQITDPRITKYGVTPQFKNATTLQLDELSMVLKGAQDYYWELERTNTAHPLRDEVEVQFYRLQNVTSQFADVHHELSPLEPNLYQAGEINLATGCGVRSTYGIKIVNNSAFDIYPKVCYLNPDDLTIGTTPRSLFIHSC